MKYVVLVSHGLCAEGLKNAVSMLAGNKSEVLALGLLDGQSIDEFSEAFLKVIQDISGDDEIILLGDIVGGSPLTAALNILSEKGFNDRMLVLGGMNLPLVLTTVVMKETMDLAQLKTTVLFEAKESLKELSMVQEDEDEI